MTVPLFEIIISTITGVKLAYLRICKTRVKEAERATFTLAQVAAMRLDAARIAGNKW
jgi:hypothetical protein